MPIPVPRFRVVNGEVQTTDHRPDGQWAPCTCPFSRHGNPSEPKFNAHSCYVDGGCPFLRLSEKGGKVYVTWKCGVRVVEEEVESVTWDT